MAVFDAIENATGGLATAIDDDVFFTFDYVKFLASGETVSSAVFAITPATGAPTLGTEAVSGTTAQVKLTGGTAGTYTVQCTATLSTGEVKVVNGTLLVEDDDA